MKGGLLIAGVGVTRSRRSRGRMISHAAAARRLASPSSMLCSSLCLMIMNIAVDILLWIALDLIHFTRRLLNPNGQRPNRMLVSNNGEKGLRMKFL